MASYFANRFIRNIRLCTLCNQRSNIHSFTKANVYRNIVSKTKLPFLALGIGLGIGSTTYIFKEYDVSKYIIPRLNAAQVFHKGKGSEPTERGYLSKQFNFIADVVEIASPAVVYIEVLNSYGFSQVAVSNGSGFIVEADGLILTNAHVVGYSQNVKVLLQDGRVFEGTVEAIDRSSDLATVRIVANGLPVLPLGNSSSVRPGEWVVAMGSPLTLSNTITAGIVSSIRPSSELGFPNKDMDFIQTDAAINFGNSGGPLINLDGEAIGINSMKVTAGISFAIPSDYAAKFLEIAKNKRKGWFGTTKTTPKGTPKYLGITMLTLTPGLLQTLVDREPSFPKVKEGVFVWRLIKNSPAHKGGMLPGDVITHINQTPITSADQVTQFIHNNDELNITIIRRNHILNLVIRPTT